MKSATALAVTAISAFALLTALGESKPAFAKVTCEDVSAQIEAKIKAKGVKDFTLTVIPKDEVTTLRVVGTCEGGAKKIVYKRGS
ncbi:MAG: DUF1161 domain-containing protein [Betaproteobacteria bacterium]